MSLIVAGEARLDWTELVIWTEQEKETSTTSSITWKLEFGLRPFVDHSSTLDTFGPVKFYKQTQTKYTLHSFIYLVVSAMNQIQES